MSDHQYKRINLDDFSVMPMCILKDDYKDRIRTPLISFNNVIRPNKNYMLSSMSRFLSTDYALSPYHFHEGIEILRICRGNANVIIKNKTYSVTENDILIVNPFENHGIYLPDETAEFSRVCLIFQPTDLFPAEKGNNKLLFDKLRRLRFSNFISHEQSCSAELCDCIDAIIGQAEQRRTEWPIAVFGELVRMYSVLVRDKLEAEDKDAIPYQYEFMTRVSSFIDENISRSISTEEISAYFGYSTGHFCRLFKSCFNRSFKEYLNICRIERAREMIDTESERMLKHIWSAVGFNNANHFSNTFKKQIGLSPLSYIKKMNERDTII